MIALNLCLSTYKLGSGFFAMLLIWEVATQPMQFEELLRGWERAGIRRGTIFLYLTAGFTILWPITMLGIAILARRR